MDVLEMEEQDFVRLKFPRCKQNRVRHTLLVLAIIYVLGSLYVILSTRSRLAAVTSSQQAAIKLLEHRQAEMESHLKDSNEVWGARLGLTAQQLQQQFQEGLQAQTNILERQQQALKDRVQVQNDVLGDVTVQVADARRELWRSKSEIAGRRSDPERQR